MQNKNFTTTLLVTQTPTEVFNTLLNVRAWWSGLFGEVFEGSHQQIGDEFSFRAGDGVHYSKQKLVELVPGKKLSWLVTESNLNFIAKTDEWNGTKLSFEISEEAGKTKIVFTHIGLIPEIECYDSCSGAWTQYIQEKLVEAITKQASVA